MRYKLNANELEIMKKVSSITCTDYEIEGDYISVDSFISAIEDLICEIHNQEERYEDLERDLQDNYIHRPMSDYTGDSYDDRY